MAVLENRYSYLHGFASGPQSTKAQFLRHCWQNKGLAMEITDLNGDNFSSLTLTRQIVQVGQLIEQSQLPVTLIGSSFGGLTAAWLAETYSQVQRLVLLAPAFNFGPIWLGQLGAETLANWQKSGSLSVYHYGYPMTSHPELLDESGQLINEPLLVIRSLTVEDARQQLDAIYNSSPSATKEQDEEI